MGENGEPELIIKPEIKKPPPNPILIFGQGPVIDKALGVKPLQGVIHSPIGGEGINFWAENLAKAASVMYGQNHDQQIIVIGGKTGGEDYDSESNLIAKELAKYGVPETAIKRENLSKDTIANLLNLDKMMKNKEVVGKAFDIMGAPFHVTRIKVLMQLLDIPFDNALSSDEILRWKASTSSDQTELNTIERRLDMNNNDFYWTKFGEESKPYKGKILFEDVLTRELLERPESWMGRIAEIEDPEKRRRILEKTERIYSDDDDEQNNRSTSVKKLLVRIGVNLLKKPSFLKIKYDINLKKDSDEEIKQKVSKIKKTDLSQDEIKEWEKQTQTTGWPEEVKRRSDKLIKLRQP